MEKELEQYDLRARHSDAEDREPIDFTIEDDYDNVCWVWGSEPWKNIQCDCDHPYQCIDWGDDDECGVCELCGASCDWHWENDGEGGQERVIHAWHKPEEIGGVVGKYLKELRERW